MQQRFPTDGRVQTALAEAKASDAETRGQWYEAVTALEALAAVRPGDQAIQNRLVSARREVEIGDLIGQLRALAAAEEWAGVVAMSQRIGELDPTRADPDGLAGTARAQLQARDLDNRYSFGLAELDRGNHRQAYEVFVAISRERPDYREIDDLLRMTQRTARRGSRRLSTVRSCPTFAKACRPQHRRCPQHSSVPPSLRRQDDHWPTPGGSGS